MFTQKRLPNPLSEITDDKNLILSQCKSSPFQEFQMIQPQNL